MTIRYFPHCRSRVLRFGAIAWLTTTACSAGMVRAAEPIQPQDRAVVAASGEAPSPQRRSDREGDNARPRTPNPRPHLEHHPLPPGPGFMFRGPAANAVDEQFRSLERILESPLFKRHLELVETNAKLRAELEIQERLAHRDRELAERRREMPGREMPSREMPGRDMPGRDMPEWRERPEREHPQREHPEQAMRAQAMREHAERERDLARQREQAQAARGPREGGGEASEVEALRRRVRELEARIRELTSRRDQPGPRPDDRGERGDRGERDSAAKPADAQRREEPRRDQDAKPRDRQQDRDFKRDRDDGDKADKAKGKEKEKEKDDDKEDDDKEDDDQDKGKDKDED